MKFKKLISLILCMIMISSLFPTAVLADEYFSLKDVADANGYEYYYYDDDSTVNMRSASYILAFQADNAIAAYKTVLGDVGVVNLYNNISKNENELYISKTDVQTKLTKYFSNLPDNSIDTESKTSVQSAEPSDWAASEVNNAIENGLITGNTQKNYQSNITREYFCELVIKLYDKLTNKTVEPDKNPFTDTNNTDVLKAYQLGIVNGVSDSSFEPNSLITRQEMCAMLVRAIGTVYKDIDTSVYEYHSFSDIGMISDWAMDSVQFAYDNNIMQGVDTAGTEINPLGYATCEQAILLVNRIYENRSRFETKTDDTEKVIETLKRLDFDDNSEVNSVNVSFSDGSSVRGVKIKEIDDSDMIYSTTGIKGSAVNITSSKNFDTATIAFDYNPDGLGETNPSDLAIGWYNTDLDRIELLQSNVSTTDHTVSIETTHFSEYVLVDSKEWYSVWQRGQTIVRETDNNGRYAENFNVQLVVDCSGSMDSGRISSAKDCTYNFIERLAENDRFSVIKFAGSASTIIPATKVSDADMESIKNAVMSIGDGGGTDFNAALTECINTLDLSDTDYSNIIVFLSDGESSVNDSILSELNDNGVRIAAVALGSGADTSVMKKLSDSTNGQYVYAEDSSDLDVIYNAIQGSLIGVDATDTDGDGLPDIIETTGMKNQYGAIIRTDPNEYDTDGDGKSDGEEMGKLVETDEVTEMDKANGITSNVYFQMVSNPIAMVVDITPTANITATASEMDSDGNFTLHIDLTTTGTIKNLYIKFNATDCLDWDVSRVEFAKSDYDGNIYKEQLAKGNYYADIDMCCHEMEQGLSCSNSHKVEISVSGDNANGSSVSVDISKENDSAGATEDCVQEFYQAFLSYIDSLRALNDENIVTEEEQKKQQAMDTIREEIDFNANALLDPPKGEELVAMKECVYMAIFDFYMAYKINEDSSWFNQKYYDNISPSDFSDGGVSASTKIVEDTKTLVESLLEEETLTEEYKYKKYKFKITMTIPIKSISVFKLDIESSSGRKWSYLDTLNDDGLSKAQTAMANYVDELLELYADANVGALKSAIGDVQNVFAEYGDNILSRGDIGNISVNLQKLDKKVANTLKEYGLADVNELLGYAWEVYDDLYDIIKFEDLCANSDDIGEVADEARKQMEKTKKAVDSAFENKSGNASTKAIKKAQEALESALEKMVSECDKYISEHSDEFDKSIIDKIYDWFK